MHNVILEKWFPVFPKHRVCYSEGRNLQATAEKMHIKLASSSITQHSECSILQLTTMQKIRHCRNTKSISPKHYTYRERKVPTQLAQCWFPGLAFSNAKIKIYFSNKIYGSNFIKQTALGNCYGLKLKKY